jgi:hypothetical protein
METNYRGIDYGLGKVNLDRETGIRFGVINQNHVGQAWYDSAEADYGTPQEPIECPNCGHPHTFQEWGDSADCEKCEESIDCELPDMAEPLGFEYSGEGIQARCGDDGDIFITKSPYFTRAQFCSPCAPGACYLLNPCDDGEKAYCFGHDWFEGGVAPYPVYSVETGELVKESGVAA